MERISRIGYLAMSSLFALGVLTQVFLVGLSLLGGRPSWEEHIGLGHTLGVPLLLMLILAYAGRMSSPVKPLTWIALGTYLVLAEFVIFLRDSAPLAAALHPVLAVVLFALTAQLPMRAWRQVSSSVDRTAVATEESNTPGVSPPQRAA
jgi:hypothetical protein